MTSQPPLTLTQDLDSNPMSTPKEKVKQEFTIKEITPVSEIPIITEVKIKEILPSPSIEVSEYSSSKSPLIPREATTEKNVKFEDSKTDTPTIVEIHPASSEIRDVIDTGDSTPSKISFSTQDSINSDIYPSIVPAVASSSEAPATTTKSPMIEPEEDHNPAFPPLPDDFTVFNNHEEEIAQDTPIDLEHISPDVPSISVEANEKPLPTAPTDVVTKEKALDIFTQPTTVKDEGSTTESSVTKGNPMLNLRSVIPTEILSAPAYVPDNFTATTSTDDILITTSPTKAPNIIGISNEDFSYSTEFPTEYLTSSSSVHVEIPTESSLDIKVETSSPEVKLEPNEEENFSTITNLSEEVITTAPKLSQTETVTKEGEEQTINLISKSSVATEVTSQTELSSLPIETSDQKPQQPENVSNDKPLISTPDPFPKTSNNPTSSSEVITVSKILPNENTGFENIETTEFILTSFGSSETSTDAVELIKISGDSEKSSAIIEDPEPKKNNVLTDLINLVSDVASINDHTDQPIISSAKSANITDSEELIPVNAVYKSKSNYNQNSITELPSKNKNIPVNKQKIIEIEDDDAGITDSPPPNDKIEPTTKRPIIDKVSENTMPENKTEKKDIEIITKSYVPTINKRPTKVVMKDELVQVTTDAPLLTENDVSGDITAVTENNLSDEITFLPGVETTPETVQDTTVSVQ